MPKKLVYKKVDSVHKSRLKAIRPYVKFNYPLNSEFTPYQKRKIKKYFDEIEALSMRNFQIYRPRKKDNLKKAQDFAQHNAGFSELKVAFIPVGAEPVKVRVRRGKISVHTDHITTRQVPLDGQAVLDDGDNYIERMLDKHAKDASAYTIQTGRYEMPVAATREKIGEVIIKLANKYSDKTKNNFVGNWLKGVNGHYYKDQNSFNKYREEKEKKNNEIKRLKRNEKARLKYRRMKGM